MPTPLEIKILMHYAVCGDDVPRLDAPAVKDAVAGFLRSGLLAIADDTDIGVAGRLYMPTEGTQVYLRALTAVPLPERVWVVPAKPTDDAADEAATKTAEFIAGLGWAPRECPHGNGVTDICPDPGHCAHGRNCMTFPPSARKGA